MAVDVGSAVGYLDLDISGFLAGLKTAQSEADKDSKNIATTIGKNLSGVGKKLTSVGTTLTKNVTVPLVAVGAAGLKVATDFEKGMSEVKAISGATGKEFDALREKAIELGGNTAFSAGEVAAAMTEMAKAGWSSSQIIDGMSGVLSAAAASGEGLATVSTIVADAITGFGMEAADSTRIADLLTQAANSGTIGITDLGESFKYIAPVAGSMGLSVEDVTTALSAMSMAGIKGSQAGTALRTMLTRMVKPTDDVAIAMDELGISVINQDGSMKSLDDIVSNLRNSFDDLTDSEKAKYAATLAGQEGMSGMLSLLNLTEEEYNEIAKSMDNAGGVAEETAAIMQDNLQSKVEQLGGSLESLAIKLADYVIPYLQQFVVWLTGLVDKFTQLDPETQKTILKFAGIAIAAGPVLAIFGKLISGVGGFITSIGKIPGVITTVTTGFTTLSTKLLNVKEAFVLAKAGFPGFASETSKVGTALATSSGSATTFGGAIASVAAPILAVVAVIAVLVAAVVSLWKNNEEFRTKITEIWNQVKATFEKLCTGIVDRLNSLGFDFENIGEVLKAIWKGFCDFLAPIFEGAFQIVADVFDTIVNVLLGVLDFFISVFKGDWEGAWNAVKGIFESIWNGIVAVFRSIGDMLLGILDVVCGWFGTTWSDTWNSIKAFFENIWNNIVTWFQTTLNNIKSFFENIWTNVSTFFQNLWNSIVTFITTTLNNIKTTFENIWNAVSTFLSTAWETIKNVVQVGIMFIVELIKAAFQLITLPFRFIWENCKETIMTIWETIKATISNVLTAIKTNITNVWNAVSTFFTTVWTTISTFISTIWNAIKTTISNVANAIWNKIESTFNTIKNIITTILNTIKSIFTTVWTAIKTTISNIVDAIKSKVSDVINVIKTTIENIINAIKNVITNVMNAISSFISTIWNAIKSTITNVINAIKSTIENIFNTIKNIITNIFNSIKSTATSIWNGIKSAIETPINMAKNTITNVVDSIKSKISSGFNSAKSTVSSVFDGIKSKISSVMENAKSTVSGAIDKVKGFFNFNWSLPKLKMPHPTISGKFSLNPPSVPKFGIEWYKKAMNGGMILNGATIFGMDNKGNFLGGGEAGSETIVGTKSLMSMIRRAVHEAIGPLVIAGREIARASAELGYVTYNGFTKFKEYHGEQNKNSRNDNNGGDIFNFYSPKAIDEIEAAKQMKKAKRELAEGF